MNRKKFSELYKGVFNKEKRSDIDDEREKVKIASSKNRQRQSLHTKQINSIIPTVTTEISLNLKNLKIIRYKKPIPILKEKQNIIKELFLELKSIEYDKFIDIELIQQTLNLNN